MEKTIRALIIPKINYKQAYIHVGKVYEERKVKTIRHEPFDGKSIYGVYDENGECICTLEDSPVVVYYFKQSGSYEN